MQHNSLNIYGNIVKKKKEPCQKKKSGLTFHEFLYFSPPLASCPAPFPIKSRFTEGGGPFSAQFQQQAAGKAERAIVDGNETPCELDSVYKRGTF